MQKTGEAQKVFKLNLQGMEVNEFLQNPVVNCDNRLDIPAVGIVNYINKETNTVAITFVNGVFADFIDNVELSTGYFVRDGKKVLNNISATIKAK